MAVVVGGVIFQLGVAQLETLATARTSSDSDEAVGEFVRWGIFVMVLLFAFALIAASRL
jgi:hypothetical protein